MAETNVTTTEIRFHLVLIRFGFYMFCARCNSDSFSTNFIDITCSVYDQSFPSVVLV